MQKRLCGREQEFGIKILPSPDFSEFGAGDICQFFRGISESVLAELGRKYDSIGIDEKSNDDISRGSLLSREDFWLANGSRIYIDQGILEVATPEHFPCTPDSVLYERASELILNNAILAFLRKNRRYRSLSLYKNNIAYDFEGRAMNEITYGSHQNYSCCQKSISKISYLLKNFLPAALPLTGNGHISYAGPSPIYCFSQRANHITCVSSQGTISNRGLINDRGFAGPDTLMPVNGMARFHLISCDATRCEFQTWLVEGILHLVIRLAEEGWNLPGNAKLDHPIGNLKNLNQSIGADYLLSTSRQKKIRVVDYLRIFLKGAKQLKPLSDSEKKCLSEWENTLDLLGDLSGGKLVGKFDWATKLYLLKNQMRKYGFDLDSGRAFRINMEYHNISPDPKQSWFARLEELGHVIRFSSDKEVLSAIHNAPRTRASARGKFIRECLRNKKWRSKLGGISWGNAIWSGRPVIFGLSGDPFSTKLD